MIKIIAFICLLGFAAANRGKGGGGGGGGGPLLISYPLPVPFISHYGGMSYADHHGGMSYGNQQGGNGAPYIVPANKIIWAEPPMGYY